MSRTLLSVCTALALACVSSFAQDDFEEDPNVRKPRKQAISGEVGFNSLSSLFGAVYSYYVTPQMAIDGGIGLSGVGFRPGLRARYNFSMKKLSPFVGAAFKYGFGTGTAVEVEDPETGTPVRFKVNPSPFVDLGVGFDYQAHNGFLFLANLGWSQLLTGENFETEAGYSFSQRGEDAARIAYGSGIGISLSFGKAF